MSQQTLPANQSALPENWIDYIFRKMESRYGSLWADRYGLSNLELVKRDWSEDLSGFTGEELKRGLVSSRSLKFPPTLPEFMNLCRPVIDAKSEWIEACEQMRIRLQGKQEDKWSREQVYWAAVAIGWHDLNSLSWDQIKTRWTHSIANAKNSPIPEYHAQLPKPGQQTISKEEAEKRVRVIGVALGLPERSDPKKWAKKILENPDNYPPISVKFAQESLMEESC